MQERSNVKADLEYYSFDNVFEVLLQEYGVQIDERSSILLNTGIGLDGGFPQFYKGILMVKEGNRLTEIELNIDPHSCHIDQLYITKEGLYSVCCMILKTLLRYKPGSFSSSII